MQLRPLHVGIPPHLHLDPQWVPISVLELGVVGHWSAQGIAPHFVGVHDSCRPSDVPSLAPLSAQWSFYHEFRSPPCLLSKLPRGAALDRPTPPLDYEGSEEKEARHKPGRASAFRADLLLFLAFLLLLLPSCFSGPPLLHLKVPLEFTGRLLVVLEGLRRYPLLPLA